MLLTLIADDMPAELQCIQFLIVKYNLPLKTMVANDGKSALKLIEQHTFDLLITDIRMPFADGIELSKKVLQVNPDCKIILISGYSDFQYAKAAMKLGIRDYLLKPLNPKEFRDCVLEVLNRIPKTEEKKEDPTKEDSANLQRQILKIQNYIHNHYMENLNLDLLAEQVHLHPVYLSKLFKQETGDNLNHYIKNYRLEKAKELLIDSYLKINEISEAVGYPNSSYFSQIFTDYYGESPARFRQLHANGDKR